MAEIESTYADTPEPRRDSRRGDDEEVKQETFETGFDHGFENMATFNGRTVGNESEQASTSVTNPPANNTTSD